MDLRILSLGERIAAASGAVLFVLLFVSWIQDQSAWQLFDIVDVLLAILALSAVALPLVRAAGVEPRLQASNQTILIRVAAVALIVILAYFLEALGDAQVGLWLAVFAAAGMFYGAATMPGEKAPTRRRDRTRRPLVEEDYEEPPPGMESWREGGLYDAPEGERGGDAATSREAEGDLRSTPSEQPEPPERTEARGSRRSPGVPPAEDR